MQAAQPATAPDHRPLDGIVVIETASFLTGPLAAMMLADLGADVIKVEPPGGDGFRSFGHQRDGFGASWTNINHGKRSIVIDLKTPEGVERLKNLLKKADVLVENWRPRVAGKLGLDQATVEQLNPRLVRLSITGVGETGPLADAMAFDSLIQGRTGLIHAEARNAGVPKVTPFNMVDKVTGTFAAQAVVAALFEREKTGRGGMVHLPMLDVMGYFNFPDMFQHRVFKDDTAGWNPPQSQVMQTSDGWVVISPANGKQMAKTLNAIERPEWRDDFRAMPDPVKMAEEFFRRVGEVMARKSTAHWLERFAALDVPAAPVYDFDQFLADEQVAHNRIYSEVASPVGPIRVARHPARFGERLMVPRSGPPAIGEHDHEV